MRGLKASAAHGQCLGRSRQAAGKAAGGSSGLDGFSLRQQIHTKSGSEKHNCQPQEVSPLPCLHTDLIAGRQAWCFTYNMVYADTSSVERATLRYRQPNPRC